MQDNQQQVEFWNGEGGQRWAEHDAQFERTIGPLTPLLLARIDARDGVRALDIGCGCGNQTLALARHLGPRARVTGIDISAPMLARARQRAAADAAPMEFLLADAATHRFEPGGYDLLFSRFGVMFFADPLEAFRNLHAACAEGARLVFCCWQAPALNDWIRLPLQAALGHVPAPPASEPHAPGPFAFADRERVTAMLAAAGFGAIEFEPLQTALCFAAGNTLAEATEALVQAGPVGALLAPLDAPARERALADIRAALEPHFREGRMMMPSAAWLVSAARRP